MSRRRRTTEEDDIEEIRKGFEMFDVNGTGIINPTEILEVMESMNIKEKNPFIYEIIESLRSEKEFRKKGGVSLEDLVNYVYNKVNDTETNVGLRQIFDVINDRDTDNVSMSTFYTLARDYGDQLSEDEIRYLLEKTQMGGNELTFDEFYTIMKGAIKDNNKANNSYMNMSRSSYKNKNNEVYIKKSSNNINKNAGDNNKKIKRKNYIYGEPKYSEPEPEQVFDEERYIEKVENEGPQYEKHVVEEIINTTNPINQNEDNKNMKEDYNNYNIPSNKEEVRTEITYEIQENNEEQNDNNAPLNYSYRKVHIGATPKYEKVVEKHVNYEVEENNNIVDDNNNLNSNFNIEENIDNDGENIIKERQTKVTNLPDGGKQVEIIEKTQIVQEKPYVRGSRYRYNKKNDNNEDEKEEKNSYYRIKGPRGSEQNKNKNEQVSTNKVEVEDNNEINIPKRYHRRYRGNK